MVFINIFLASSKYFLCSKVKINQLFQRCYTQLRLCPPSLGAPTNGYESSRWLSPISPPILFSPISPSRLIFTTAPPPVLLAIARLGHTQGSIVCQTLNCIPMLTPSKTMAHILDNTNKAIYMCFVKSKKVCFVFIRDDPQQGVARTLVLKLFPSWPNSATCSFDTYCTTGE